MIEGIYSVSFKSNQNSFGSGIAVFTKEGQVGGGDDNYFYRGTLTVESTRVSGQIQVAHYQGQRNSIFGPLQRFNLNVSADIGGEIMILRGHVVEHPSMMIEIHCRKVSDL